MGSLGWGEGVVSLSLDGGVGGGGGRFARTRGLLSTEPLGRPFAFAFGLGAGASKG